MEANAHHRHPHNRLHSTAAGKGVAFRPLALHDRPLPNPWQVASNDGSGQKALDLYSCCCVTGYGMVPLILVSAALLLVPK